ncbi:hypothetical protein D3C83_80570 [compost metagenome]
MHLHLERSFYLLVVDIIASFNVGIGPGLFSLGGLLRPVLSGCDAGFEKKARDLIKNVEKERQDEDILHRANN